MCLKDNEKVKKNMRMSVHACMYEYMGVGRSAALQAGSMRV